MAEIVNLRLARKRATRKAGEEQAEANRILHSIPAKKRKADAAERNLVERRLDGARRNNIPDGDC
jgi:Domain of unknown function (DUF4169)